MATKHEKERNNCGKYRGHVPQCTMGIDATAYAWIEFKKLKQEMSKFYKYILHIIG